MLENLDKQLRDGVIDQHTYSARRLEIEELIRTGKAFLLSTSEKIWLGLLALVMACFGVFAVSRGALLPLIGGVALIVFAINRLVTIIRH